MTNTAERGLEIRTLEGAEIDATSGGLGPLAIVAIMAASAAAGAAAGALSAPGKINWDKVLEGFPKPA